MPGEDEFFQELETFHQGSETELEDEVEDNPEVDAQDQGTQDETEGEQQEQLEQVEPPKKFAGKYDTPEDLERAYQSTNAEATRMAQRMAQMEAQLRQVVQPQQPVVSAEERNRQFLVDLANDPQGTISQMISQGLQPIQQATVADRMNNAVDLMSKDTEKFPLFDELRGDIADILEQNPQLHKSRNPVLEAYHMVAGRNIGKFVQHAMSQKEGIQQQNQQIMKQSTVVTGGSQSKAPRAGQQTKLSPEQEILQGILNVRNPVTDFINL
jgi:hypothetical protein